MLCEKVWMGHSSAKGLCLSEGVSSSDLGISPPMGHFQPAGCACSSHEVNRKLGSIMHILHCFYGDCSLFHLTMVQTFSRACQRVMVTCGRIQDANQLVVLKMSANAKLCAQLVGSRSVCLRITIWIAIMRLNTQRITGNWLILGTLTPEDLLAKLHSQLFYILPSFIH